MNAPDRIADSLGAVPELARARTELAVIRLRRGEQREGFALLDAALRDVPRLDLESEAARAAQFSGTAPERAVEPIRPEATSIILFTDVVDSTRLTEELGASHYRARARQAERAITGAIPANGGTIVTGISLGDGFIGLFPTVAQAVDAARRCTTDVPPTGLHLHIGVHQGELIVDGDRIYGPAVNMAARVCGLSGPDEILVSESIRDRDSDGRDDVRLVDRGEHQMKGIAAAQRVYTLVGTVDTSVVAGVRSRAHGKHAELVREDEGDGGVRPLLQHPRRRREGRCSTATCRRSSGCQGTDFYSRADALDTQWAAMANRGIRTKMSLDRALPRRLDPRPATPTDPDRSATQAAGSGPRCRRRGHRRAALRA